MPETLKRLRRRCVQLVTRLRQQEEQPQQQESTLNVPSDAVIDTSLALSSSLPSASMSTTQLVSEVISLYRRLLLRPLRMASDLTGDAFEQHGTNMNMNMNDEIGSLPSEQLSEKPLPHHQSHSYQPDKRRQQHEQHEERERILWTALQDILLDSLYAPALLHLQDALAAHDDHPHSSKASPQSDCASSSSRDIHGLFTGLISDEGILPTRLSTLLTARSDCNNSSETRNGNTSAGKDSHHPAKNLRQQRLKLFVVASEHLFVRTATHATKEDSHRAVREMNAADASSIESDKGAAHDDATDHASQAEDLLSRRQLVTVNSQHNRGNHLRGSIDIPVDPVTAQQKMTQAQQVALDRQAKTRTWKHLVTALLHPDSQNRDSYRNSSGQSYRHRDLPPLLPDDPFIPFLPRESVSTSSSSGASAPKNLMTPKRSALLLSQPIYRQLQQFFQPFDELLHELLRQLRPVSTPSESSPTTSVLDLASGASTIGRLVDSSWHFNGDAHDTAVEGQELKEGNVLESEGWSIYRRLPTVNAENTTTIATWFEDEDAVEWLRRHPQQDNVKNGGGLVQHLLPQRLVALGWVVCLYLCVVPEHIVVSMSVSMDLLANICCACCVFGVGRRWRTVRSIPRWVC